jgi:hypothetical protein
MEAAFQQVGTKRDCGFRLPAAGQGYYRICPEKHEGIEFLPAFRSKRSAWQEGSGISLKILDISLIFLNN